MPHEDILRRLNVPQDADDAEAPARKNVDWQAKNRELISWLNSDSKELPNVERDVDWQEFIREADRELDELDASYASAQLQANLAQFISTDREKCVYDVFLSYPRSAREKVEPIRRTLERMGLSVFFDVDGIDGGEGFPDKIDQALRSSRAVLACWTSKYFSSKWCMIECRFGDEEGTLVPVVIERFESKSLPADLRRVNYHDISDCAWAAVAEHEGWRLTLRRLSALVKRDLAP